MAQIYKNNMIVIHRGDTIIIPTDLNRGDITHPNYYDLKENDKVYFALLEPNQMWEKAILKKTFTYEDWVQQKESCNIEIDTEDTKYLLPGDYYYQVKLYIASDPDLNNNESVTTIIPRTRFVIID